MANKRKTATGLTWQRLTRKEAVDFLITAMIVCGQDPEGELLIDGDPGTFLEKASKRLDIDWSDTSVFPRPGESISGKGKTIPFSKIVAGMEIVKLAKLIGYEGDSVKGIVEHLRSLPAEGPIGQPKQ